MASLRRTTEPECYLSLIIRQVKGEILFYKVTTAYLIVYQQLISLQKELIYT